MSGSPRCVANVRATQEQCDLIDNDCDGQIDEDAAEEGAACETGLLGLCSAGTVACTAGILTCAPETLPGDVLEICNGVDDDCDGETDDDPLQAGASCQTTLLGVCATGALTCSEGTLTCARTTLPGDRPEACNGLDDDCDGVVDEGGCDDGNPCTDDVCVSASCVFTPDDANVCSAQCVGGTCGVRIDLMSGEYAPESGSWFLWDRWAWDVGNTGPVLHGSWGDYSVGCEISSGAILTSGVDLSAAPGAQLRFRSLAVLGEHDQLELRASADGDTWTTIAAVGSSTTWTQRVVNLSAYIGQPSVQIAFIFYNECGDAEGVDWSIDEVALVVEVADP